MPAPNSRQMTLTALEAQYREYELDESEMGKEKRAQALARLRRVAHEDIHPNERMVEVDIPEAVTGEAFKINDVEYKGVRIVPECVAQQLLWMVDENRRVDMQRMQEQGRTVFMGHIGERARAIQDES